jgi:hypothetical protein
VSKILYGVAERMRPDGTKRRRCEELATQVRFTIRVPWLKKNRDSDVTSNSRSVAYIYTLSILFFIVTVDFLYYI